MKYVLTLLLAVCAFGCTQQYEAEIAQKSNELIQRLVSSANSVTVCDYSEPQLVTNDVGQVWLGYPIEPIGTVTTRQEVVALSEALAETGCHGDSGVCFCGALPEQLFLDSDGRPLVSVLVHENNNHVIIATNLIKIDNTIYAIWPTGEVLEVESSLPSGDNPIYGQLALQMVKQIWPEECIRRELKGCADLIKARAEAEAQQKEKESIKRMHELSESL